MKIIYSRPPNFDIIKKAFPLAARPGIIFAYGDTIYAPSGKDLPPEIIAHEEAHGERQLKMGVDAWWDEYIKSVSFRYDEELIGHRAEYAKICEIASRQVRRSSLKLIAKKLSDPLYGNMASMKKAISDISSTEEEKETENG